MRSRRRSTQLLAHARELSERGALEESLDPLRQAAKLDPSNTVIRTVLVNSLLDDARRLMQKPDWEAAEARLKELLVLDSSHAGAKSLASQIGDRKHEEFASLCITQARRLQAEGDLARAIAVVAQGLKAYPNDARFEQLQATLQRAQSETQRQPATLELRETPNAGADLTAPAKAPQAPAATPPPPASEPSATLIMGRAVAQSPPLAKVTPAAPRTPVPPVTPPPAPPGKPAPGPKTQAMASRNLLYATAGLAAVVLVIVVGVVIARLSHHPPPVAVATYRVSLRTSPEGAAISVNGRPCGSSTCQLQLPAGNYRADATLSGYQNATVAFAVTADKSAPGEVSLILEALPAQVTLSTDLTEGTLSVDGAPAAQIQAGEKEIPNLSPGQHKLDVQGGGAKASLSFEFPPSALPKLTEPIQAHGINAVVISRYGSQAMVYCSIAGVAVAVDGKLTGATSTAGVELKDLAPGPHEVQVTINGLAQKIPFESSAMAGISAYLLTERNVGALRIMTGYDDAVVYLNGQKSTLPITRGRLMLYLPPKQYAVRVEKPGLWAADQTVNVRRGEEAQLTFKLVPAKATLEVHGAPEGTEVLLDGTQIGSTRDGGFSATNIEPGKHTVALKNDRFRTIQAEYEFEPGKSITLEGAMQSAAGTLKIEVSPPVEGLQLRLVREGETREQVATEKELNLPEGNYRVTGTAPQYQDAVETVHVTAGGEATAKLTMKRVGTTPSQTTAQAAFSIEEWAKAGGSTPNSSNWTRDGKLWVKRGGEFVVAPIKPLPGTYIFTVILMRGKRLEWVVNYRDDKNYDLFQLDDKSLVRTQFVNGKKRESVKRPLSVKTSNYVSIMITVTSNSIVHSLFVQQQWQVVDKWERPGGGLQGKIGFHLPGKDQIGVSEFRFTAN